VDEPETLREILLALNDIAQEVPVIFPMHPRTRRRMEDGEGKVEGGDLIILEPLGYLDFLALMKNAALVLTDLEAQRLLWAFRRRLLIWECPA